MALSKKFYPVIHCINPLTENGISHALVNTKIALRNGADGVFLIGHGLAATAVAYIYDHVRRGNPEAWIGINFLDIDPSEEGFRFEAFLKPLLDRCVDLNALWFDKLPKERLPVNPRTEVFGGVAFKYINSGATGEALLRECSHALSVVDVITTSGDKTGQPPNVEKMEEISTYTHGQATRAIASGLTDKNIRVLGNYAERFLVSTSICRTDTNGHDYLVPEKVRAFKEAVPQ